MKRQEGRTEGKGTREKCTTQLKIARVGKAISVEVKKETHRVDGA